MSTPLSDHHRQVLLACVCAVCCVPWPQPGPAETSQGLSKGQVAGIVVGCLLFGVLMGALGMLCWVKRRRLFPDR